jgi:NAD(P)-dependent dehydrogenase (short-subunit alcohol dehydrogenase family)
MSSPKNIVITGVSRGLGEALVRGFIEQGQTVYGCSRSDGAVKQLARRFPAPHDFQVVDVAQDAAVAGWAQRLVAAGAVPDLLLNSAALINANARLWEVPPEEFSAVIDVNIKGVYHVLRHFVPAMVARGSGVIVNFSSGWGRSTAPEVAPYCCTKWAIEGLTRALAEELPSGMAAIPLNPGIINTAMLQSCFGADAAVYRKPRDWAATAVPFLLGLGPRDNGRPLTVPGE